MLLFGAAGIALTNADVDGCCSGDKYRTSGSNTLIAETVGGGLEEALADHVLLRAQYLYDDYGSKTLDVNGGPPHYGRIGSLISTHRRCGWRPAKSFG